ncbi:MAG: Crp/Fnr family transcriptional regulator [Campylobacteraceae bacterium]|jgi:CRP/FNR family transcriptional regulator|nr:Crp/Fnr family transcriptional regulator [Campylobacteraceae bacterium]
MYETLKAIPLFSGLSDSELEKLSNISRLKKYKSGEILFYEKETPIYMYILKNGEVKVFKTNIKGTRIFLHDFKPISLVAELPNFENIPYPASAEFTKNSEIVQIDFKKLESDFFKNPDISHKIIRSLSQKLRIISEVLHQEISLNAEAKVAKFILEKDSYFGNIKDVQIAAMLNITPETLSRTLAKFKKQDLIKQDKARRIIHKDINNLNELLE